MADPTTKAARSKPRDAAALGTAVVRVRSPRSSKEAIAYVVHGLVYVSEGCRALPADYHHLGALATYLWQAVRADDVSALQPISGWIKEIERGRDEHGFGSLPIQPQDAARVLAADLDSLKARGFGSMLRRRLENEGRREQTAGLGDGKTKSRRAAADWLALHLNKATHIASPAFRALSISEASMVIYRRMPLDHGRSVDRTNGFLGDTFAENSDKTVIAAFKAAGYPEKKADNLFHAKTMRRSRRTSKRMADAKGSSNKRRM